MRIGEGDRECAGEEELERDLDRSASINGIGDDVLPKCDCCARGVGEEGEEEEGEILFAEACNTISPRVENLTALLSKLMII